MDLEKMSKEGLVKLCRMFAKNWLAHDGCWFLGVEERHGLEHAIEIDKKSWERFTVVEARRIMEVFQIPANGGLEAIEKALSLRLYAVLNKQTCERAGGKLVFKMVDCRVQSARRGKGLPDFPCKEVGLVEYEGFARTIDPRIKTRCLGCPPDKHSGDFYCGWEFSLDPI